MKKWITTVAVATVVVAAGLVIRQICRDFSENADMWTSVTDDPEI